MATFDIVPNFITPPSDDPLGNIPLHDLSAMTILAAFRVRELLVKRGGLTVTEIERAFPSSERPLIPLAMRDAAKWGLVVFDTVLYRAGSPEALAEVEQYRTNAEETLDVRCLSAHRARAARQSNSKKVSN